MIGTVGLTMLEEKKFGIPARTEMPSRTANHESSVVGFFYTSFADVISHFLSCMPRYRPQCLSLYSLALHTLVFHRWPFRHCCLRISPKKLRVSVVTACFAHLLHVRHGLTLHGDRPVLYPQDRCVPFRVRRHDSGCPTEAHIVGQ